MWCDPCPPWSQVACKLTSPSPAPTVPHSNYVPFYDDITTLTSLSPEHSPRDVVVTFHVCILADPSCLRLALSSISVPKPRQGQTTPPSSWLLGHRGYHPHGPLISPAFASPVPDFVPASPSAPSVSRWPPAHLSPSPTSEPRVGSPSLKSLSSHASCPLGAPPPGFLSRGNLPPWIFPWGWSPSSAAFFRLPGDPIRLVLV